SGTNSSTTTTFSGWDQNAGDDITTAGGTITSNSLSFGSSASPTASIQASTGNITTSGTVDGVDVSALNGRVTVLEQQPKIVAAGVLQSTASPGNWCGTNLTLIDGYNISSVSGGSRWTVNLTNLPPVGAKLLTMIDDITYNANSQPDMDLDCLVGMGIMTYSVGDSINIARCSVASSCNNITNKALSFVVYQLP
ncbi:MAG: hypothetical protein HY073_00005, partial [Deltaproteobacteria bacterium]|nr:hypothetical protein [Deltaproteobacteria bacterium]